MKEEHKLLIKLLNDKPFHKIPLYVLLVIFHKLGMYVLLLTFHKLMKYFNICGYYHASPSSIAKAHSSLSYPSIITSIHCRSIYRPSLRSSSLFFPKLEPRLREISLGTQVLPARVSYNCSYNCSQIYSYNCSQIHS